MRLMIASKAWPNGKPFSGKDMKFICFSLIEHQLGINIHLQSTGRRETSV